MTRFPALLGMCGALLLSSRAIHANGILNSIAAGGTNSAASFGSLVSSAISATAAEPSTAPTSTAPASTAPASTAPTSTAPAIPKSAANPVSAVPSKEPFPHLAISATLGSQRFNSINNKLLAQYGLITIGGNFPGWPSYGLTRSELVAELKTQPHSGRNALTPFVAQYEDVNEIPTPLPNSEWFPEWNLAVNSNNWYLRTSGTIGTLTPSLWNSSYVLVDMAHAAGVDRASGLYPYALAATLIYERYYLGTGTGGAAMASTQIDAYIVDNMSQRNMAGGLADWLRNGSSQSSTDSAATAAVTLGKADYPARLAALNPSIVAGGNSEFGYDCSPTSAGGLGMQCPTNLTNKLGLTVQQFIWSTEGTYPAALDFAGFEGAMVWYETAENNTKAGGHVILTGGVLANDYQLLRYSLAFTLMRNGWAQYAISSSGQDNVDPEDASTFPAFDEFWGGSLDTAGYLGAASADALGAEQSSAWKQGVWRRDFENGIVLANPSGNGAQTISLGATYYHLRGSQQSSINDGAAVSSVSIAPGDGVILLNSAPP